MAATIHARAGRPAAFKRCCMRRGRFRRLEARGLFPQVATEKARNQARALDFIADTIQAVIQRKDASLQREDPGSSPGGLFKNK